MKTKLFAILLILVASGNAFAQIKNIKVSIGANTPVIGEPEKKASTTVTSVFPNSQLPMISVTSGTIKEKYDVSTGFNVKGSLDYEFSPRFFITSGLSVSYVRYQRTTIVSSIDSDNFTIMPAPTSGMPISSFYGWQVANEENPVFGDRPRFTGFRGELDSRLGKTELYMIQIPVMAGTTFFKNKIVVRGGITTSFVAQAKSYQGDFYGVEKKSATNQFTNVSIAGAAQVDYNITSRFALELSGQHFFNPLYKSEYRTAGKTRLNLLSAGVSFKLK